MSYQYDPRSRRYRNEQNGRYVSFQQVRANVDQMIQSEALTMRQHARDLMEGRINFAEWQLRSLSTIKSLHMATALAANGGKNNTSPGDLAFMGNLVKEQYQYFRNMVAEIRQGKQALDGTLLTRVALYAQAARATHEKVKERAALNAGATQSKSILGLADHCTECVSEARKGWVAIGTLIQIGQRQCRQNCHCSMTYR